MSNVSQKKKDYFEKLTNLVKTHEKIILVKADNVGSHQFQTIRSDLRGKAEVLMGKNTMIKKCFKSLITTKQLPASYEILAPHIAGNVGFVFVKNTGDLKDVADTIRSNKVAAPARPGAIAPCDVWIPAGNTGLEPNQTAFLQALNIATKISKGAIEVLKDVHLITIGTKVGNSESALLTKLSIRPFAYGLQLAHVFDNGSMYDPSVLDITDDDLEKVLQSAISNVAAVGLETGIPNKASFPHQIAMAFKNVAGVALASDYDIPQTEAIRKFLADPEAMAAAAAAAAAVASGGTKDSAAKEEKKEEEEEEEEEEADMGFSLFD